MITWIRVWTQKDIIEIQKHLLVIGDTLADCASCREIGLDPKTVKACPSCQSEFSYITSRRFESHPSERFQIIKHLNEIRHDLTWIDYEDYKKLTGRQQAREFFLD